MDSRHPKASGSSSWRSLPQWSSTMDGDSCREMEELTRLLRDFARERDWEQFHSPKNLAMALSVEVAEIVEIFQWLTQEQSRSLDDEKRARLREEIGDVMIYLASLAEKFGIDVVDAAKAKVEVN